MSDVIEGRIVDEIGADLLAERERLEIVLGNISEGVTITAPDGRFLFANAAAARLIGIASPEVLVALPPGEAASRFRIYDGDGAPMPLADLPGRRARAGEEPGEVLVRFRPVDGGEERMSIVRAIAIRDEAGAVQYVINFFREVTAERRRAAREAFVAEAGAVLASTLDAESALRAVAELAVPRLADVCTIDLVDAGGAARRLATVPGDACAPSVGDATISAAIETRGRVLGTIGLALVEPYRRFEPGDVELVEDLARRAGIALDHARLFEETRRSESLLDALFASAPVGLGFWDRDLRYVRLNEALAEINGLPLEEHLGRRVDEVLPGLDPEVFDAYRRVLETKRPVTGIEVHGETPAQPGIRRTWIASYYPILDDSGAAIGVGGAVLEVTAREQSEQRLRLQHAVTAILAEGATRDEAIPRVLEEVAELLEWDVGAYWPIRRGAKDATCRHVYAAAGAEAFAEATRGRRITPGESLAGAIWATGEPQSTADLGAGGQLPAGGGRAPGEFRSGFGFPAVVGGDVVGVFEFFSRAERRFDPQLLDVVATLGRNVGQFVERQRAEQERARLLVAEQQARAAAESAAETLRKLGNVAEVALAHLPLHDLLNALLERVVGVLDADTAAILLLNEAEQKLTVRAAVGLDEQIGLAGPVPLGEGLAGRVAARPAPLLVDDLDAIELVSPVLRARGLRSVVAIPLVVEERVIGVVHAGSEQLGHFTPDHVRLLELIADRIALAVNQTALYEAEREAQERLSFMGEASTVLASSLAYEETLSALARLAVPRLADWCAVDMLVDGEIERLAVTHVDPDKVAFARRVVERRPLRPGEPVGGGLGRVLRTGEPLLVEDVSQEQIAEAFRDDPEVRDWFLQLGLRSYMIVPLVARGRTLGAISFVSAESGRRYGPPDVSFVQELAARAAIAVDNARLYRVAEEGRERLGFLAEASALLASALDPDAALTRLSNLAAGRIADWCAIHLTDDHGLPRLVAIAHREEEKAAAALAYARTLDPSPAAEHGVSKVIRTGEPELFSKIPSELLDGRVRETGVHSTLIVPLNARGRTLGAVTLAQAESPRPFTDADVGFAEDLARRAGVAVDNAQLYREAADRAQAARVLASVGDGVVLVDRSGVIRYWNRAAAAITGLSEADVIDRPVEEAIPGWMTIAFRAPVAVEGATNPRPESLPLALGDRELWLSVAGVEVADGVVFAFRDLTEDRALDELKTEFISTVSHELRTPLAAIYGAAMTLRRSDVKLDSEQRDSLLAVVSNEADRLARIVNDILWASRLDTDTLRVAIESCDPLTLTRDVVTAQQAHVPPGIEIRFEPEASLPLVAADPDKVRQVLVNLVDNGIKYSPDGGRVIVTLRAIGGHVRFSVTDEGLGIPYAEHRRIFEKFYRVDPNMTRGIGGTGLGLYICRELVRRMGGRIWVESEPGRGSTFNFELPIAGTEAEVVTHQARGRTSGSPPWAPTPTLPLSRSRATRATDETALSGGGAGQAGTSAG